MSRRRKNAGEGYGYMFSGAFSEKKDAVKKEKSRKGSFIKGMPTKHGYRYVVMTPRTNPIKRKKKEKPRDNSMAWGRTKNPSELLVMGANPHENIQEIVLEPGSKLIIRNNPARLRHNVDDRYMYLALSQLYPGRVLGSLTARELSQVAQLAAKLKHGEATRKNIYFGFGPAAASERLTVYRKPRGVRTGRSRPRERIEATSALRAEVIDALVSQGYKQTAARKAVRLASGEDFSGLFRSALEEVRRTNPLCGSMIGGYPCTRKPGHKGPHLPQGATMRTRTRLRHAWQPNPSAEALREKFTGMGVYRVSVLNEPHMPKGDYAMLGKLLSLYVKPYKGGQVLEIKASGGTIVVADESARQIYFVGGDQDISSGLAEFGAVDRGAGVFELGEARRIDYRQRKEHVPQPDLDSWRHEFGEESGERPTVFYDSRAKRLLLEGGAYVIRAEGIVN